MDKITPERFRELAQVQDLFCLSFFIPTARAGKETTNNPTRLRKLVAEARRRLAGMGCPDARVEELLEPVAALDDDYEFWQHQEDGLAVLRSDSVFERFPVQRPAPELLTVAHRFHLKPLLPHLANDSEFHILALSQGSVRLLRADDSSVVDVSPDDMPRKREDYAPLDSPQRGLNENSGQPRRPGTSEPYLHGHGLQKDYQDALLRDFLHAVDRAVNTYLKKAGGPLVLAGVDNVVAEYRKLSKHPGIVEATVPGAVDGRAARDLHAAALKIIGQLRSGERQRQQERLHDAVGDGELGRTDLREISIAAAEGRVDTAFIALDGHEWGNFDPATHKLDRSSRAHHCTEDLIDYVAVQTILHGGKVYPVQRSEVPSPSGVAAILRY